MTKAKITRQRKWAILNQDKINKYRREWSKRPAVSKRLRVYMREYMRRYRAKNKSLS